MNDFDLEIPSVESLNVSEISDFCCYEDLILGMEDLVVERTIVEGMIEMKFELKVPKKIKHAYQEQNSDQR